MKTKKERLLSSISEKLQANAIQKLYGVGSCKSSKAKKKISCVEWIQLFNTLLNN